MQHVAHGLTTPLTTLPLPAHGRPDLSGLTTPLTTLPLPGWCGGWTRSFGLTSRLTTLPLPGGIPQTVGNSIIAVEFTSCCLAARAQALLYTALRRLNMRETRTKP